MTRVPDTCILVFVQDEEKVARTATFDTLISLAAFSLPSSSRRKADVFDR